MKAIKTQNKKGLIPTFTKDVPAKKLYHGNDPLLDKLVNPQNGETVKKLDLKKAGALLLAPAIIAGGLMLSEPKQHAESSPPMIVDTAKPTPQASPVNKNNIYIANYKNTPYYFATEEYVLSLANDSLNRVKNMLSKVDGITPVGSAKGDFYPEYFNC